MIGSNWEEEIDEVKQQLLPLDFASCFFRKYKPRNIGKADSVLSVFWYLCFTVSLSERENHSKLGSNNHLPKCVLMKTNRLMHSSQESSRGTVIYPKAFWNGFPSLLPDIIGIKRNLYSSKWLLFVGHYLKVCLSSLFVFKISNFQGCRSIEQAIR